MATQVTAIQPERSKAMVIPREHGAWGMLLVPLATGAVAAARLHFNGGALALFTIAALAFFWLRTPVEALLGTSAVKAHNDAERSLIVRTAVPIAVVAIASISVLFAYGFASGLLTIGAIAAAAFIGQAIVKKQGRRGRMPAQVIGAIGLTSTAAAAYYVASGRFDQVALTLWVMNWLFAANQIQFVQMRIHAGKAASFDEKLQQGQAFLAGQIVLAAIVLTACRFGIFPAAVSLAFVPVLVRGTLWFVKTKKPLNVHTLGLAELTQAIVFGVLLCAGFLFA